MSIRTPTLAVCGCAELRLAVVSPFVDRRHGTERALAELLERLARSEHCQIHLYAQRVEDLAIDRVASSSAGGSGAIRWHKVPSVPGPHLLQFLAWFFLNTLWRRWDRWVHGVCCDLVLSPGINCLDADAVIVHAVFHRLKELAREEEPESARAGLFRRLHRRAYYGLLTALERRIYADPKVSLAAVSPRTAGLLGKYFGRHDVRVIPHGVDTSQFSPASRLSRRGQARRQRLFHDNDFVLLLVGNDWANKGLPSILETLPKLSDTPARVLIVGDDASASSRGMAARLGVLDRCSWEPARADILDAYAAADVYVSPSREDSFGMPVAEAMACGMPVITSSFAGISSLLHDGVDGFVLGDPRDAETLAKLIRMLWEQGGLRSRMGQAAAKTTLEWTWDGNAAAVWKFLQEASAKKHST
jgi:UDP-glucose:(heptosyl)LPS alpha-1,3-glucosyltransferase